MPFRFAYGRPPAVALNGMVATSQPLATRAGLRDAGARRQRRRCGARRGGSAVRHRADVDRHRRRLLRDRLARRAVDGLDAAGPAPRRRAPRARGGARARFGHGAGRGRAAGRRWPSATAGSGSTTASPTRSTRPSAGYAVAPDHGRRRGPRVEAPAASSAPSPSVGERVRLPELAATLRAIAERRAGCLLPGPDRAARSPRRAGSTRTTSRRIRPRWVEPLRGTYRELEVLELPPPTQGGCALEALGLLEGLEPDPAEPESSVASSRSRTHWRTFATAPTCAG